MKDIVFTGRMLRRELIILAGCLLAAVIFDLVAIIMFKRPAVELITTIGYEIAIALVLYLVVLFVRLLVLGIRALFCRKGKAAD